MDALGLCARHGDAEAALSCARCGAFTCAACTPAPSILCAACAERVPGPGLWSRIPPPPRRVVAELTSEWVRIAVLIALVAGVRYAASAALLGALLAVGSLVILGGIFRLAESVLYRPALRRVQAALGAMRAQDNARAAVLLEETLRSERLPRASRALALWLHATCVSALGHPARSRATLEPLTPSGWRHVGTMRLLRGPGQIVLAVTRALDGDAEGARAARAAYAPSLLARFVYSPAYGDLVLALLRGEREVRSLVEASHRHARRVRDEALARSTALLDAFDRHERGEPDADVELALLPARLAPVEAWLGLSLRWPRLRHFVERRLVPAEATSAASFEASREGGGSPLTPERPLR